MIFRHKFTYDSTTTILDYAPLGWDETEYSMERNKTYHSIFRSYALSLRFLMRSGGGGDIILAAYDSEGIDAEILYDIEIYNPQTDDYDNFINSKLDLKPSSLKFDYVDEVVEVSLIDNTKLEKFKARDDVDLDLRDTVSIDGVNVGSIDLDVVNITYKKVDINLTAETNGSDIAPFDTIVIASNKYELRKKYAGNVTLNQLLSDLKINDNPDDYVIYENNTNAEVTFFHSTDLAAGGGSLFVISTLGSTIRVTFQLFIEVYDSEDNLITKRGVVRLADAIEQTIPFDATLPYEIEFSYPNSTANAQFESVPSGGRVEMYTRIEVTSNTDVTGGAIYEFEFNAINIRIFSDGEPDSIVECYFPHEAFTKLIKLTTSETDPLKLFRSEYLGRTDVFWIDYESNGFGARTVITDGKNLRGFPSHPINVSIQGLFKSFDSLYCLGLGYDKVNDQFYIEDRDTFFNETIFLFDLGEVSGLKIMPNNDSYYNAIQIGSKNKVEYETVNGVNEIQTPYSYSLSSIVKNDYKSPSVYNTDTIGQETLRRLNYKNYTSLDNKNDENIYLTRVNSSNTTIQGVSGLANAPLGFRQYYNHAISPRENLLRHTRYISPSLSKKTKTIKFIKSQKNINFTYRNQYGNIVNELDNIEESEFVEAPLFRPELHEFETPVTVDIISTLNTTPHGFLTYQYEGVNYSGFIENVSINIYSGSAQWTIIPSLYFYPPDFVFEDDIPFTFEDGTQIIFE